MESSTIVPSRIRLTRYAHNPVTIPIVFEQSIPSDISVLTSALNSSADVSAFMPTVNSSGQTFSLTLTAEKMTNILHAGQVIILELKWSGLIQAVIELYSTLSGMTAPQPDLNFVLSEGTVIQVTADVQIQQAIEAANTAESALASLLNNLGKIATVTNFSDLPSNVGNTFKFFGVLDDETNNHQETVYVLVNNKKLWFPLQVA